MTGTLTMGDFTWANIGSGVVFTTLDGGAFAGAGFNSVARLTATVEVDRSNFQFGNGNPGASTAVAPANVAVFNLLFTVTGQLNNPEV
ncbi:hypothetical protein RZS08_66485, partial [Arthrospira platensis SPKY1]|nr:hypothetical protein [Arthrospira platensis SPKY1]